MRLREINRWHIAGAFLLTALFTIILWFQLMKVCAPGGWKQPTYCSVEETWAWLRSGGDWRLWTLVGFYVVCGLGLFIVPDKTGKNLP